METGAIVGTVSSIALYLWQHLREKWRIPHLRFIWSKFLQAILAGCAMRAIMGVAADKIEPSTNTNHGGFFTARLSGFYHLLPPINYAAEEIQTLLSALRVNSFLILSMQTMLSRPPTGCLDAIRTTIIH